MKFTELDALIPYAKGGKEKILTMKPYRNITIAMPGRHALDTVPVGGDFVVMVSDKNLKWRTHQFTHNDIFDQFQRIGEHEEIVKNGGDISMLYDYFRVVHEDWDLDESISNSDPNGKAIYTGIVEDFTMLCALQCLAVAEHRRYSQYEKKYGGKYLPLRFAAGIVEGLWSAEDASSVQRMGRPGVESLEALYGKPRITKELMG